MVAEILGLPQATVVTKLEVGEGEATAHREIEGGTEKVALTLPAVITAQKGLNEPRYETLKGIMAAKKKEIPVLMPEDLGLAPADLASQVAVVGLDSPAARQAGKVLQGDPAETARELVRLLRDEAKVI
jgi:electron transfer flavoprotein beta subunit